MRLFASATVQLASFRHAASASAAPSNLANGLKASPMSARRWTSARAPSARAASSAAASGAVVVVVVVLPGMVCSAFVGVGGAAEAAWLRVVAKDCRRAGTSRNLPRSNAAMALTGAALMTSSTRPAEWASAAVYQWSLPSLSSASASSWVWPVLAA